MNLLARMMNLHVSFITTPNVSLNSIQPLIATLNFRIEQNRENGRNF